MYNPFLIICYNLKHVLSELGDGSAYTKEPIHDAAQMTSQNLAIAPVQSTQDPIEADFAKRFNLLLNITPQQLADHNRMIVTARQYTPNKEIENRYNFKSVYSSYMAARHANYQRRVQLHNDWYGETHIRELNPLDDTDAFDYIDDSISPQMYTRSSQTGFEWITPDMMKKHEEFMLQVYKNTNSPWENHLVDKEYHIWWTAEDFCDEIEYETDPTMMPAHKWTQGVVTQYFADPEDDVDDTIAPQCLADIHVVRQLYEERMCDSIENYTSHLPPGIWKVTRDQLRKDFDKMLRLPQEVLNELLEDTTYPVTRIIAKFANNYLIFLDPKTIKPQMLWNPSVAFNNKNPMLDVNFVITLASVHANIDLGEDKPVPQVDDKAMDIWNHYLSFTDQQLDTVANNPEQGPLRRHIARYQKMHRIEYSKIYPQMYSPDHIKEMYLAHLAHNGIEPIPRPKRPNFHYRPSKITANQIMDGTLKPQMKTAWETLNKSAFPEDTAEQAAARLRGNLANLTSEFSTETQTIIINDLLNKGMSHAEIDSLLSSFTKIVKVMNTDPSIYAQSNKRSVFDLTIAEYKENIKQVLNDPIQKRMLDLIMKHLSYKKEYEWDELIDYLNVKPQMMKNFVKETLGIEPSDVKKLRNDIDEVKAEVKQANGVIAKTGAAVENAAKAFTEFLTSIKESVWGAVDITETNNANRIIGLIATVVSMFFLPDNQSRLLVVGVYLVTAGFGMWIAEKLMSLCTKVIESTKFAHFKHKFNAPNLTMKDYEILKKDREAMFMFKQRQWKLKTEGTADINIDEVSQEQEDEILVDHRVKPQAFTDKVREYLDPEIIADFVKSFGDLIVDSIGFSKNTISIENARKFVLAAAVVKSAKDLIMLFFQMMKGAYILAYEAIFKVPFVTAELRHLVDDAKKWVDEANKFLEQSTIEASCNFKLANSIFKHMIEGRKLSVALVGAKLGPQNFQVFFTRLNDLKNHYDAALGKLESSKSRKRPVVICMFGEPGIGKSVLTDMLAADLYKLAYRTMDTAENLIYDWTSDMKYWDGYGNHFCLRMDDYLQVIEGEHQTNVAMTMIRIDNDSNMPLEMARADEKGHFYFRSPVVITTANKPDIGSEMHLQDPEAFMRRRQVFVKVELDDDYKTVDQVSGARTVYTEDGKINPLVWKFTLMNTLSPAEALSRSMTYPDFLAVCFMSLVNRLDGDIVAHNMKDTKGLSFMPGQDIFAEKPQLNTNVAETTTETHSDVRTAKLTMADIGFIRGDDIKWRPAEKNLPIKKAIHISRQRNPEPFPRPLTEEDRTKEVKTFFKYFSAIKESYLSTKDKVVKYTTDTYEKHKKTAKVIGTLVGALTMIGGVMAAYKYFNEPSIEIDTQIRPQINTSGDEVTRGRKLIRYKVPPSKFAPYRPGRVGPQFDEQAAAVEKIVSDNLGDLQCLDEKGEWLVTVNICMLQSRLGQSTYHQIGIFEKSILYLRLVFGDHKYTFALNNCEFFIDADGDRCLINFPTKDTYGVYFPEFSSLKKHIRRGEDPLDIDMSNTTLVARRKGEVTKTVARAVKALSDTLNYTDGRYAIPIGKHFDFYANTVGGDCGGIYVVNNTQVAHKIVGMHVAGGSRGIGTWMDWDYIEEILNILSKMNDETVKPQHNSAITLGDHQKLVEVLDEKLGVFQPGKTQIRKSMAYEMWQPATTHPARLRPFTNKEGERISPVQKAVLKSNLPEVQPSHPELGHEIARALADATKFDIPYRTLTWEEAYNGVEGWKYVNGIKTDTSVGYIQKEICDSYNLPFPPHVASQGKQAYLNIIEDRTTGFKHITPKPEFQKLVEDLEILLTKQPAGKRVLFEDLLKDARVSLEKFEAGDTRLFSGSPMDFLIVVRKYFGWFTEICGRNHVQGRFGVGLDPHKEWDQLANWLLFGHNDEDVCAIAGDGKKFDASLRSFILACVRTYFNRLFQNAGATEVECLVATHILMTCAEAFHIVFNIIYQTIFGNPSGQPLTTPVNSVAITIKLIYCICLITGLAVSIVIIKCRSNATGDDHILTWLRDNGYPQFAAVTMKTIAETMEREFGMEYTDFLKRPLDQCPPTYSLGEVEYLKRSLKKEKGRRPPRLRRDVIDEMPYWVKCKTDDWDATRSQMEKALTEMGYYPYKEFMEVRGRFNKLLRQLGLEPLLLSYNELQQVYELHSTDVRRVLHIDEDNFDIWLDPTIKPQADVSGSENVTKTNLAEEQQQLTAVDVTAGVEEIEWPSNVISPVYKEADPYADSRLQVLLTRMYQVYKTTWTGAHPVGGLLSKLDFPKLLFDVENIADKLRRFQWFRGGVKLYFKLNSTAMHYGTLLITGLPYCQYEDQGIGPFYSVYTAASNPCMLLDANDARMQMFVLPYLSPSTYLDMEDATASPSFIGRVMVYVLNPLMWLDSAVQPSVDLTVWAHFVEPEVAGPTLRETFTKISLDERDFDRSIKPQGKIKHKKSHKEQETRTEKGVITRVAERTAYVAGAIATFFPPAAEIAAPVAAIASAVATGASMFGLSQPTLLPSVQPVTLTLGENHSIVRGGRTSEMLALDPQNAVADTPIYFNADRDYSLFQNYKQLPGLIDIINFSASTTTNQVFYTMNLNPMKVKVTTSSGIQSFHQTPLANLANMFNFWTGGFNVAFYFTCSQFTSFTLGIAYYPVAGNSTSISNTDYGDIITKVVDVRGPTVVKFNVPYLQDTLWQRTLDYEGANVSVPGQGHGFAGCLKLFLINKVTVSNNATNTTVYANIFMSGGPDFDVAMPRVMDPSYTPFLPALDKSVRPQSYNKDAIEPVHDLRRIFSEGFPPIVPAKTIVAKQFVMGETISSFKELGHRLDFYKRQEVEGNPLVQGILDPWVINNTNSGDEAYFDLHSRIMSSFLMARGSWVNRSYFRTWPYAEVQQKTYQSDKYLIAMKPYIEGDIISGAASLWNTPEGAAIFAQSQRPYIETRLPFYANVPFVCSQPNPFTGEDLQYPELRWIVLDHASEIVFENKAYRAFGDDFSLGYAIGLYPLFRIPDAKKTNKNSSTPKNEKTRQKGRF